MWWLAAAAIQKQWRKTAGHEHVVNHELPLIRHAQKRSKIKKST
jgi:hypothetical protein